jgi:hypothetical protein
MPAAAEYRREPETIPISPCGRQLDAEEKNPDIDKGYKSQLKESVLAYSRT